MADIQTTDFTTTHGPNDGHYHWLENFPYEIIVTIIEVIMAVVILMGNGLVIAAYISDRKLRTVSNFFLVNLVISDFIVGLVLPISCGIYFVPANIRSPWLCTLQFTVVAVPLGSSTLCLLLITVERYLSVVYPFHYQQIFTKARRYSLVIISWALALLIMGVLPFTLPKHNLEIIHKLDCDMMRVIPSHYWSYVVLPFAYILFASVIIVYMKILHVARAQIKSIELLVLQVSVTDKKNIQNVKLARTGFILLGVFIMCWMPITIILTITVAADLKDNQILTIARIIASVIAPASSFLNPIIYAARIRRFKIRMKKFLRLTISNSDKFDTYEIRQSFKVKRVTSAIPPNSKTNIDPTSADSGVGGSSFDEGCHDECGDFCRRYRSLSRISESPETSSQLSSSPPLDNVTHADTRRMSVNNQTISLSTDPNVDHIPTLDRKRYRTVKPPQFLDIPSTPHEASYISKNSYKEELSSCTTVYDDLPSPFIRAKTPTQIINKEIAAAHRNSGAAICAEPIVIDCDNKSEYFRLVVRRTVRDCSDSDSDQESRESTVGLSSTKSYFKSSKQKVRSKIKAMQNDVEETRQSGDEEHQNGSISTPDSIAKMFPTNGTHMPTLERPSRMRRANHQRSPSALSNTSVGMTLENDEIQFEISNTHRGSKRMSKLVQLGHASLQRRQKKVQKRPDEEDVDGGMESAEEGNHVIEKQPQSNLVRDIWDGTIRRLRSGKSRLMKQDRSPSTNPNRRLERQLSQSLSDVSKPTTPSVQIIHQRSRSALEENETYTATNPDSAAVHSIDQSVRITNNRQSTSVELQIDVNRLRAESNASLSVSQYHTSTAAAIQQTYKATTTHKRVRLASWSYGVDEDKDGSSELATPNIKHSSNNYSLQTPTDNYAVRHPQQSIEAKPSDGPIHIRSVSNPYTMLEPDIHIDTQQKQKTASIPHHHKHNKPTTTTAAVGIMNDVMLPVKLRLPGGMEQDILLTKQDIYGNHQKPKRRHKSVEASVKRKRSMSQPNLDTRHLAK